MLSYHISLASHKNKVPLAPENDHPRSTALCPEVVQTTKTVFVVTFDSQTKELSVERVEMSLLHKRSLADVEAFDAQGKGPCNGDTPCRTQSVPGEENDGN